MEQSYMIGQILQYDNIIEIIKLLIDNWIDIKDRDDKNSLMMLSKSYDHDNIFDIICRIDESGG